MLAYHDTGLSNGPSEAMNLLVKKIKRVGHGFRNFDKYRLWLWLHCGVVWTMHRPHDFVAVHLSRVEPVAHARASSRTHRRGEAGRPAEVERPARTVPPEGEISPDRDRS